MNLCICAPHFLTLPVVKEELLSLQNGSFGKDSNAVVSIHHYHCDDISSIKIVLSSYYRNMFKKKNQAIQRLFIFSALPFA